MNIYTCFLRAAPNKNTVLVEFTLIPILGALEHETNTNFNLMWPHYWAFEIRSGARTSFTVCKSETPLEYHTNQYVHIDIYIQLKYSGTILFTLLKYMYTSTHCTCINIFKKMVCSIFYCSTIRCRSLGKSPEPQYNGQVYRG
jgi:hypothetical protein